MDDKKYFSHTWALLTRDKGWIKPLLVMAAASLVPFVGAFGNNGYALEWARLSAWGVDAAPKQKNVDVGKCVTSGARAFVVALGLGLVVALVTGVITLIINQLPGTLGELIAALVGLSVAVVRVIAGMFISLAQLRCAIYESIGAGYRLDRVFELVRRDVRGFLRVFVIQFVCGLVIGLVVTVFILVAIILFMPLIMAVGEGMSGSYGSYQYSDSSVLGPIIASMIVPLLLVTTIFCYVASFLGNAVMLICTNALGLWLRQFDVPNWGRSEDPLPQGVGPQQPTSYAQPPMGQPQTRAQQPVAQPPMGQPPMAQPTSQQHPTSQPTPAPGQQPPQNNAGQNGTEAQWVPTNQGTFMRPSAEEASQETMTPLSAEQPEYIAWDAELQSETRHDEESQTLVIDDEPAVTETLYFDKEPAMPESRAEEESKDTPISMADELYNDLADAVRENDRVPGDD